MRILWAAVAGTLVLSIASGCSSKSGKPKSSPTTSVHTSSAPTTVASTGGAPTKAQLRAALLKASDIGASFSNRPYVRNNNPLPCARAGTPSFRKQTAPTIDDGATLDSTLPPAELDEQIFVYADAAAAAQALSVAKKGLGCTSGTSYGSDGKASPITIGKATDVAAALLVDAGFAWSLTNKTVKGTAAALQIGPAILTLTFATATSTDTTKLPDALAVAKAAVAKLKTS